MSYVLVFRPEVREELNEAYITGTKFNSLTWAMIFSTVLMKP